MYMYAWVCRGLTASCLFFKDVVSVWRWIEVHVLSYRTDYCIDHYITFDWLHLDVLQINVNMNTEFQFRSEFLVFFFHLEFPLLLLIFQICISPDSTLCAAPDQNQRLHRQCIQCQWTEICGCYAHTCFPIHLCYFTVLELWLTVFPSVVPWCSGLLHVQVCNRSVHTLYSTWWVGHFSPHDVYMMFSISSHLVHNKSNMALLFQNWHVSKSEWTLSGECFNTTLIFISWPCWYFGYIKSVISDSMSFCSEMRCCQLFLTETHLWFISHYLCHCSCCISSALV